jgi:hypothetical protein
VRHTGLDQATLRAGVRAGELHARWKSFARPTDVVCAWGHYEPNLFVACGGELSSTRMDLRHVARDVARKKVGSLEEYGSTLPNVVAGPSSVAGRAGRKLQALADIIASFIRTVA